DVTEAAGRFMRASGADIARLAILRDGESEGVTGEFRYEVPDRDFWQIGIKAETRDVLRLGGDYAAFHARMSRYTRRNIRRAEPVAEKLGLKFVFRRGADAAIPVCDVVRLAAGNAPGPIPERIVRIKLGVIGDKEDRFVSWMETPDGTRISLCLGYVQDRVAHLVFQANDAGSADFGLSLLHRSRLIGALIAGGVTDLIFLYGCQGYLGHACEPTVIEERLVIRVSPRGLATAAIVAACLPRNRIGELSRLILLRVLKEIADGRRRGLPRPARNDRVPEMTIPRISGEGRMT
ncbi:MAG TPA: GNAT family N-acetyltransferase, partial [Acidiphilium sp.]